MYMGQQGKKYTKEQRETAISSLQEWLEFGFSRARACGMVGMTESTLSRWVNEDHALGMKVKSWENKINRLATQNIVDALNLEANDENDKRKETTKWWMERRMKKDYSTRIEQDLTTDGEKLPNPIYGGQSTNKKEV